MEFLRINNRKNFLITSVPTLHPQSLDYIQYWKSQKKRCIEGFWSQDNKDIEVNVDEELPDELLNLSGNWRFMPGNCYFYVNFCTILHKPEDAPKSAPKKKIRPLLRDIEWEFFYNWLEARGFSGYSDDEKYTCHRDLIDAGDKTGFKFDSSCYNSKGDLKEYINARDYLRLLQDKPLGIPLYQNRASDLFLLGSRGLGKSFLVGAGVVLHELVFDGAKIYNDDSIKNPYKVEIFVGAALSSKSADILKKTKEAMDSLPGAYGDNTHAYVPSPLSKQMKGTLGPNNMKNPWVHEYSKKLGGSWKTLGSGSNIKHGIYTIENPEAAAGGRYSVMVVEEWGLLPNSLTVQGSNDATMQDAPWKFGSCVWIGTGGNVEKIQEGEIMFRDPEGFDALAFDDIWEGTGKIGWFIPSYYAMNDYKDENGNTYVEEAKAVREKIREQKKKAKDSSALALEMMNYPIVPSEMFLNAKGSFFPQAELKAHMAEVIAKPHQYQNTHWFVELVWDTNGQLKLEHSSPQKLVREWPIKDNKDKPGTVEIFEMPKKNSSDEVYPARYLQGTDTYDDDESSTNSLGCTWILDSWTDRIVAEYTGRRETTEFYEITRKLNLFYRAEHNYEQNKKGLYSHYNNKNSTHLLCDTPESLKDVANITISKIGNKRKGTFANAHVNAHGLRLINSWLLTPAYGEDENSEILNLHKIRSIGLLQELTNYNSTGNFDRVSALIMLMILRDEKVKYVDRKKQQASKTLAEDPFFSRNFKPAKQSKFAGIHLN